MSVWKPDEKLLIFVSLFLFLKSFCLRSNIKHLTQCFTTRWNTSKFIKNTFTAHHIFNSLLGASSDDKTMHLMLDIIILGTCKIYIFLLRNAKIIDNAMCNCKAYWSEILEIISYCMCCVLTYLSESFLGLLKNISLFVSSNFGM